MAELERLELLVRLDHQVRMDRQEPLDLRDLQVRRATLEQLDPKALLVALDKMVVLEPLEPQERLVHPVRKVAQAVLVHLEQQAQAVPLAHKETRDPLDQLELLE